MCHMWIVFVHALTHVDDDDYDSGKPHLSHLCEHSSSVSRQQKYAVWQHWRLSQIIICAECITLISNNSIYIFITVSTIDRVLTSVTKSAAYQWNLCCWLIYMIFGSWHWYSSPFIKLILSPCRVQSTVQSRVQVLQCPEEAVVVTGLLWIIPHKTSF